MQFLICERTDGIGCDYTIGCGMTFYFMDADSIEDAQEKVIWPDGHDEYYTLDGESARDSILIIPAEHVFTVDIIKLKLEFKKHKESLEQNKIESIERAELKRLQDKYESDDLGYTNKCKYCEREYSRSATIRIFGDFWWTSIYCSEQCFTKANDLKNFI